jgi:hypothetical protein
MNTRMFDHKLIICQQALPIGQQFATGQTPAKVAPSFPHWKSIAIAGSVALPATR